MPEISEARDRPGLSERQRKALARLGKVKKISEYQRGQLAAYRLFGDPADVKQAETILRRHPKKKGTAK